MTTKPRAPRRPASSGKTKRPQAPRRLRASVPATGSAAPVTVGPSNPRPGDAIALNTPATWLAFAFLFAVAAVLVHARWLVVLVVIIAGFVVFFRALFWLCQRFPKTMFVITCIVRGFFGGRRW
jgi:hypothetical protein